MALSDLTDGGAVRAALEEFDSVGRRAFLTKYGFGAAREYFLLHGGKSYDSKAIVGAAHLYQHGRALRAADFSGGDATVAARLHSLGFEVVRDGRRPAGWVHAVGDVAMRAELSKIYGGSAYGGIEPSAKTPNVLVFTDREAGKVNGYNYDVWESDDLGVFHYTGEGRYGNQEFKEGNRAILEHKEKGRTLRLFEAMPPAKGSDAKPQRYLGAFGVDEDSPYRWERAPDAAGEMRNVIVFRLVRIAEDLAPSKTVARSDNTQQPATEGKRTPTHGETPTSGVQNGVRVERVDTERNTVYEFETAPRVGGPARRIEGALVADYDTYMRDLGRSVGRFRIRVPGEVSALVTDTCDLTEGVLYEAKSSLDRATVRLGVGQLLDYLRFLPEMRGSLLLPAQPSADLTAFVLSAGLMVTFRSGAGWESVQP